MNSISILKTKRRFHICACIVITACMVFSFTIDSLAQGPISRPKTSNSNTKTPQKNQGQTVKILKESKKAETSEKNPKSNITDIKKKIPATQSSGLKTDVLYNFGRNEILYYNEFSSNMKTAGRKFAAVTIDTITKQESLIINGKKVKSAYSIWPNFIDLDNNRYVYGYKDYKDGDYYVSIDGVTEGPYEDLYFGYRSPKSYSFKRMGKEFRRDSDGTIYNSDDDSGYASSSGRYKLKFTDDFENVTFDGKRYSIPLPNGISHLQLYDAYVSEKGIAFFELSYDLDNSHESRYYKISRNEINILDDEEYDEQLNDNLEDGCAIFENVFDPEDVDWEGGMIFTVYDPSKRHLLTSRWDYDYVMIDNVKIPCTAPFCAFYDKEADLFAWVSQEGSQLVLYTYKI